MTHLTNQDSLDTLWQSARYVYFLLAFYISVLLGIDGGGPPAGGAAQVAPEYVYERSVA